MSAMGAKRERIEIRQPVKVPVGSGTYKTVWKPMGVFWAQISPLREDQILRYQQMEMVVSHNAEIYMPEFEVSTSQQLVWFSRKGEVILNIVSFRDEENRGRHLKMLLKEVPAMQGG